MGTEKLKRKSEIPWNWTHISVDLLGTVFLYVDYTVAIPAIRVELRCIAENSEHRDGRACTQQVTNATERTQEMPALVSAPVASRA